MIFPPSGPASSPRPPRRPTLRTQILIGAACAAALITGVAYLVLRRPAAEPASLRAALDAFTGEWQGEASIELPDGQPALSLRATRRYSWVGEKQIVETRFVRDTDEYETRAIQWIEDGMLKAVLTGPDAAPTTFAGAPTADGILWTNQDQPQADSLDRIVIRQGRPTVQSASFTTMSLGNISGKVSVAAVLTPRPPATTPGFAPTGLATDAPSSHSIDTRVADLERQLAAAAEERVALRALLERAERNGGAQAPTGPAVEAATSPSVAANPPAAAAASRLEIKTTGAGVSFDVRAMGKDATARAFAGVSGTTAPALLALPPGEYAVTLRSRGAPNQTYRVVMRENMDVILYHRLDDSAVPRAPLIDNSPPSPETNAAPPSPGRTARLSEIDEPPSPIITVLPHLRGLTQYSGQFVNVSMLVDELGVPKDPAVTGVVDEQLKRLCLDAVAQWRFRPAQADGHAVSIRVTVPFAVR